VNGSPARGLSPEVFPLGYLPDTPPSTAQFLKNDPMKKPQEDPVLRSSRREALIIAGMWLVVMFYSVLFCYFRGYRTSLADLKLVWGIPDWAFWGVIVPWVGCAIASILFGTFIMKDEPLGDDLTDDESDLLT